MILVTGASGFIASYVIEKLTERGEEVTALDIKEKKFDSENVRFVRADVRDGNALSEIAKDCEGVIHLAAQISVQKSVEEPLYDFEENALGTLNALEAARKNGMKRFVYSSSAAVYGKPSSVPISEEEEPAPISPYGISKLAGERYVLNYTRVHGLGAVALRIFNVYGKGQAKNDYAGVITKFKENVSAGKPPVIYGDGKQVRDFVNVNDVADAIVNAYYSQVKGEAVNIGSGKGVSVLGLAEMVIKASGKPLKPVFENERLGDIKESVADVRKARELLKWEAKVGLGEGLQEV